MQTIPNDIQELLLLMKVSVSILCNPLVVSERKCILLLKAAKNFTSGSFHFSILDDPQVKTIPHI